MTPELPDDDLLDVLRNALEQIDPVPSHIVAAASGAHVWHNVDAELAQLTFDSRQQELVDVRSAREPHQFTFGAPGVEIEIVIEGESRRIVGQLVPAQIARVELSAGEQLVATDSDSLGRFHFDGVDPGPIRLAVIASSTDRLIHTEWIVI